MRMKTGKSSVPVMLLEELISRKGVSKKALAKAINVPASTLSTWINRGLDFPVSYLVPISNFLDIKPTQLLFSSGEDDENNASAHQLLEDEAFLIDTYRLLDHEGKIIVTNRAIEELRRIKKE